MMGRGGGEPVTTTTDEPADPGAGDRDAGPEDRP